MLLNITIIKDFDVTQVLEAGVADPCIRQICLWLAQRSAKTACSIVPRGMHQKGAPTTTDIKQPLTREQTELTTRIVQFPFLCTIQVCIVRLEIRTRIHHAFVEEQFEKFVRNVVVICNCLPIALPGMAAPIEFYRGPTHTTCVCSRQPQQKRAKPNLARPAQ